jgi:DNA-binding transcriptional MocR family regulator
MLGGLGIAATPAQMQVRSTPRLGTPDQLNRVIYARKFSKTLSSSLRAGLIACTQEIANELADVKMLTSITCRACTSGSARRCNAVRFFERLGVELFVEPTDGMFLWARLPHVEDSLAPAEASQRPVRLERDLPDLASVSPAKRD